MRLLSAAVAGLLLVSGCSGNDSNDTSPTPKPEATEKVAEAKVLTADDLTAALLTVDDLPDGFSFDETALEEFESTDEIVEASADSCAELWEETETPFGDEDYVEAAAAFAGGELGPFLTQDLIVVDESTTADEFASLQLAVEECTSFVARDADGFETAAQLALLDPPDLGDKNLAFEMQLTLSDGDIEFGGTMTMVMTSVGGNLMILTSLNFEMGDTLDADEFDTVARTAVARLQDTVDRA